MYLDMSCFLPFVMLFIAVLNASILLCIKLRLDIALKNHKRLDAKYLDDVSSICELLVQWTRHHMFVFVVHAVMSEVMSLHLRGWVGQKWC